MVPEFHSRDLALGTSVYALEGGGRVYARDLRLQVSPFRSF